MRRNDGWVFKVASELELFAENARGRDRSTLFRQYLLAFHAVNPRIALGSGSSSRIWGLNIACLH